MIYLDTSAAVKLVRPELHSVSLSSWLEQRRMSAVVSSVLIEVELARAVHRIGVPDGGARAAVVLRGIGTVLLSPEVVALAAGYRDRDLRSLDAIHLASAQHVVAASGEEVEAFLAYDRRLLSAAEAIGLRALSPGSG